MADKLRSKTLSGLFWSFFERTGQQGVQFVISIVLARMLLPEQFGLIAMLALFMAVAQSFLEGGFGLALIQKQDATRIDESSVFYFNIVVGFLGAGGLFVIAPWISAFYNTPQLTPITRVLALNLIINAFGLVQTALLIKRVDFRIQMKIVMIAGILSGAVSIGMAYKGYGVWSLVVQSVSSNIIRTLLLWMMSKWRPIWAFSYASMRSMFAFGSKLLASDLMETLFNNIYLVVIGKFFSPESLGYYSRASGTTRFAMFGITNSIWRVTYPVFASIQDDKVRLRRGVEKALAMMVMIYFPLMVGLAVVAKPLVVLLLTEKWLPCVPYLQLLTIAGMLHPMHIININVLRAQGHSNLYFNLGVVNKIVAITALLITYRWGIIAMIYGQLVSSAIGYYVNTYYTGKLLDYPFSMQVKHAIPSLAITLVMGAVVYIIKYAISNMTVLLILQVVMGIAIYVFLCRIFKLPAYTEIVQIIKPKLLELNKKWKLK